MRVCVEFLRMPTVYPFRVNMCKYIDYKKDVHRPKVSVVRLGSVSKMGICKLY